MKKSLLLSTFALLNLNASTTISLDNSSLNAPKTIYFSNDAKIIVSTKNSQIIMNNRDINIKNQSYIPIKNNKDNEKISDLLGIQPTIKKEMKKEKYFKKVIVTKKIKEKNITKEVNQTKSIPAIREVEKTIKVYKQLPAYTIDNIVSKILYNRGNINFKFKKFLVVDRDRIYYVTPKEEEIHSFYSILKNKEIVVNKIYLKIDKTIKISSKGYSKTTSDYDNLMELYIDKNGDILQLSLKNKKFKLKRVYNKDVANYEQKRKILKTEITKPYDLSSKLTSIFLLKNNSNQYRLKFVRELSTKNKNIIETNLELPNKIFNPRAPLDLTYSFSAKSFNVPKKVLFEVESIFKENGNIIYRFSNRPNQRYAALRYTNSQNQPDKNEYYNANKRYYTFSNIINLLEWMKYNNKNSQSIMMFLDRIKPINYDISISNNSFKIKKGKEISFSGEFNKYGYVKEISINNKKLLLEDLYSTTTKHNKKILENFKKSHHLVEIKSEK